MFVCKVCEKEKDVKVLEVKLDVFCDVVKM